MTDFYPIRDEHHIMMAIEAGARLDVDIERMTRRYRPQVFRDRGVSPLTMDAIRRHLLTLVAHRIVEPVIYDEDDRLAYELTSDGVRVLALIRSEQRGGGISRRQRRARQT